MIFRFWPQDGPKIPQDGPKTPPRTILEAFVHDVSLLSQQNYTKKKSGRGGGEAEGSWAYLNKGKQNSKETKS